MRKRFALFTIFLGITSVAYAQEKGIASYYVNPTCNGMIAAHKSLPLGTHVRVLNLDNGRSAVVRIVDRGPFVRGRIIDVSPVAALALGFRGAGVAHVAIDRL